MSWIRTCLWTQTWSRDWELTVDSADCSRARRASGFVLLIFVFSAGDLQRRLGKFCLWGFSGCLACQRVRAPYPALKRRKKKKTIPKCCFLLTPSQLRPGVAHLYINSPRAQPLPQTHFSPVWSCQQKMVSP